MSRDRGRAVYLDLIEDDRKRAAPHAAAPAGKRPATAPLSVRRSYPHRRQLQRELGHHYETCKRDNARKFKGKRLEGYCAAVSWTVAKKSHRYDDYFRVSPPSRAKEKTMRRTPPRDPRTGHFMKSARRRPKSGSESRRRQPRARSYETRRRPHAVRPYTMQRAGRTIHVQGHRSRETRRPRASSRRRSSGRRSGPTNIAIVPVGGARETRMASRRYRRRSGSAKAPPLLTAGGVVVFCIGGLIGYEVVDLVDRYLASDPTTTAAGAAAPVLPSGVTSVAQYNDLAVASKPSMGRIFWGLGNVALGFVLGRLVPWSGLKLFFYGWGAAATFHVGGQLINTWIVMPLLAPAAGAPPSRLFTHEVNAEAALNPSTPATGTTQGMIGHVPNQLTSGRGTPISAAAPQLPNRQPARVPVSLATGRPGTLGAQEIVKLKLTPPNPNPSGFTYVPEGTQVTATPPANAPPPNTPPPGTPASPSTPGNLPGSVPGGCGPSGPAAMQQIQGPPPQASWQRPCCTQCGAGGGTCGCGGGMGEPPAEVVQRGGPARHPLYRQMLVGHSSRRAA